MKPKPLESLNHLTTPCVRITALTCKDCCGSESGDAVLTDRWEQKRDQARSQVPLRDRWIDANGAPNREAKRSARTGQVQGARQYGPPAPHPCRSGSHSDGSPRYVLPMTGVRRIVRR